MFVKLSLLLSLTALALAAPSTSSPEAAPFAARKAALEARALDTAQHCGQYDNARAGNYILNLDQWGRTSSTPGSDCAQFTHQSGNTVGWKSTWSWSGGGIKSYSNIQLTAGINKQLSAIKSAQSTWTWTQSGSGNIVSDVAYDLFTSPTSGGSNQNAYEIMIWLANYNSGPISYNYNAQGHPVAIESNINLAGHSWNLYYGNNGYNYVYSFLPASGTIPSFSGDVNAFLKHLTGEGKIPSNHFLTTFEAGTEATSGSGVTFTTSAYSATIA